ncbi:unnamed protein product [Scytosiphon promiscuus]
MARTNVSAASAVAAGAAAVSVALVAGFVLGRSYRLDPGRNETARHRDSTRGGKRRARVQKSEDRARAAGRPPPPPPPPPEENEMGGKQPLSRRTRNRLKKLAPSCLALDAWTRVAQSYVTSIGAGDYESLLLLPRSCFIGAGRFVPYAECRQQLVTLGQARASTSGVEQLRVLFVSCLWAEAVDAEETDWAVHDFETTRAFLERNPDLSFVYVGRSCVEGSSAGLAPCTRVRQLVPALLRSDAVLVLPRQTGSPGGDHHSNSTSAPYTDLRLHVRGSWLRMVLAVAALGQAKVFVAFRAERFPESVVELELGKNDVGDTAARAVRALRSAAKSTDMAGAAVVEAACENWLSAELNPLSALEEARTVVSAARKSADVEILDSIQCVRPASTREFAATVRVALGEEFVEGERELALCILLFTVLCSQPKERGTYTDGFLESACKVEISYRPIAVVRSPYRERFGTPRQPQVTASVLNGGAQEGQIVFLKGHGYEEALQDLSGFDMIWVISHMHLNKGWNPKVRPPRLPEERKGLFSTRSPHRPNAIALSSLRVGRVDAAKGVIYVDGLDLLDGTPVLDIKPYIAYCDAFPSMKAGWLEALGSDHEAQGDYLPKFSAGAALNFTTTGPKGVLGSPSTLPSKDAAAVEIPKEAS